MDQIAEVPLDVRCAFIPTLYVWKFISGASPRWILVPFKGYETEATIGISIGCVWVSEDGRFNWEGNKDSEGTSDTFEQAIHEVQNSWDAVYPKEE